MEHAISKQFLMASKRCAVGFFCQLAAESVVSVSRLTEIQNQAEALFSGAYFIALLFYTPLMLIEFLVD